MGLPAPGPLLARTSPDLAPIDTLDELVRAQSSRRINNFWADLNIGPLFDFTCLGLNMYYLFYSSVRVDVLFRGKFIVLLKLKVSCFVRS